MSRTEKGLENVALELGGNGVKGQGLVMGVCDHEDVGGGEVDYVVNGGVCGSDGS